MKISMLYVCLKMMKEDFVSGYRAFIGIDGCHLKGSYISVMLSIVSLGRNN
jgi:hypothetical protein